MAQAGARLEERPAVDRPLFEVRRRSVAWSMSASQVLVWNYARFTGARRPGASTREAKCRRPESSTRRRAITQSARLVLSCRRPTIGALG